MLTGMDHGGNGRDWGGEIQAVRREVSDMVDHQGRADQRITALDSLTRTTLDRIAVSLGRTFQLEQDMAECKKMLAALCTKFGV